MRQLHILLVEDNEGDIFLTREALDETKKIRKVTVVNDGDEAINFLDSLDDKQDLDYPDFVFLDINLPKRNGHEVLQYIKSSTNLRHIPVMILTTSSYENDINLAYQNYASAFITKSVEVDQFINDIGKIIDCWTVVQLPTINKRETF